MQFVSHPESSLDDWGSTVPFWRRLAPLRYRFRTLATTLTSISGQRQNCERILSSGSSSSTFRLNILDRFVDIGKYTRTLRTNPSATLASIIEWIYFRIPLIQTLPVSNTRYRTNERTNERTYVLTSVPRRASPVYFIFLFFFLLYFKSDLPKYVRTVTFSCALHFLRIYILCIYIMYVYIYVYI